MTAYCLKRLNVKLELNPFTDFSAVLALNKIDKPGSYSIVEEVRDTLFDEKRYREYLQSLPEVYRPEHLVK